MSFTFTNNPENTPRDLVRILVNDTAEGSEKVSDETIAWALSSQPSSLLAAAAVADVIAGQFAEQISKKQVGDLALWYADQAGHYRSLAKTLRLQGVSGAKPYTGGISISDKQAKESDTDRPLPAFAIGQMDNPSISASSSWS